MSNSSLVNYTKISPYSSNPRTNSIKKITIHHMAGNLSVETCGNVFQSSNSSANYGIGTDGRVGMYVEEKNRSWASSSPTNDHQAITIEVANSGDSPNWKVSDTALAKLIDLCTDICERNGIKSLNYTGDTAGNLTRHNMFASTTCPGPYLQGKFSYIADEVNKKLGVETSTTEPETSTTSDSLSVDGLWGQATTKALQEKLGTVQDGIVSAQSKEYEKYHLNCLESSWEYTATASGSLVIKALQKLIGVTQDGIFGNKTALALQKFLSVTQDGYIGVNTVKALQTWLNK
ncbi:MAG: N-acetylmuramoyl-L-alanine amidase [Clostridia bacterium]